MTQSRISIRDFTPERPLFFLHIPKTAGTTIRVSLEHCFPKGQTCPFYFMDQLEKPDSREKLQRYSFFRGHFPISRMESLVRKPMTVITFLRHPIDQIISNFQQWKRSGLIPARRTNNPKLADECRRIANTSLEEFIESDYTDFPHIKNTISNQQTYLLGMDFRLNYTHEGRLKNRSLLASAKEKLEQFLVVGTMEDIEKSLMVLSYRLVMPKFDSATRMNRTSKKEKISKDTLPESLRKEMSKYVSMDLELYEFARQRLAGDFREMAAGLNEAPDLKFSDPDVRNRLHEKIALSNETFLQ